MNEIQIKNVDGVTIEMAPAWAAHRDELIASSQKNVRGVVDTDTASVAVTSVQSMKKLITGVEKARKEVKAPVLALGKKIDAIAEAAVTELLGEVRRIESLILPYEQKRREIIAEQERVAAAALAKIEAERLAAEAAVEEKRLAEVAAAAKIANEVQRQAAEEAAHMRAEAANAVAKAQQEAAVLYVTPVDKKTSGTVVKKEWSFEAFDLAALFKSRPDMCKIEPNTAEINKFLREFPVDGPTPKLPGLEITLETTMGVRS
jgi:hypothetical protein